MTSTQVFQFGYPTLQLVNSGHNRRRALSLAHIYLRSGIHIVMRSEASVRLALASLVACDVVCSSALILTQTIHLLVCVWAVCWSSYQLRNQSSTKVVASLYQLSMPSPIHQLTRLNRLSRVMSFLTLVFSNRLVPLVRFSLSPSFI